MRISISKNPYALRIYSTICALIATAGSVHDAFAQGAPILSKEACAATEKGTAGMVALRKSGHSREQVKSLLVAQVPRADREKMELLGKLVDNVFNVDAGSLDSYPRRMYELCMGIETIPQPVPPKTVESALSKLRVDHDKMTGIKWYFHPSSPRKVESDGFYLYFGKDESGKFYVMHLITRHYASDSLFVKDVWAKTREGKVSVPLTSTIKGADWLRDHAGGKVWEQFDSEIISKSDIAAIRSIAYSEDTTLRFEGSKYYRDRQISSKEILALREVIQVYETVTGKPWK